MARTALPKPLGDLNPWRTELLEVQPAYDSIILIGFMGCGKTTQGSLLALILGREFVDLDKSIEKHTGKTIKEIFTEDGEEYFRKIEQQCFDILPKNFNGILAAGGGFKIWEQDAEFLSKALIVFLDPDVSTLLTRLKSSVNRPLLPKDPQLRNEYIRNMLLKRKPHYLRNAKPLPIPVDEAVTTTMDRILQLFHGQEN
jgi:shikimate kinase